MELLKMSHNKINNHHNYGRRTIAYCYFPTSWVSMLVPCLFGGAQTEQMSNPLIHHWN